ncbi:MAG: amidohydrolase family protein [Melioribacteraceae bacterium]|nr:amidohydrolase family protein [Melioribacteraceae bacterium]
MNKQVIIPKAIVTVNNKNEILYNHVLVIEDGIISSIKPEEHFDINSFEGLVHEHRDLILIPGFVQTHIHLCQTLFRGLADDLELLDWLQMKIFPYENAHDINSLSASVRLGIAELQLGGATTILDMGTINHQDVIFNELIDSKMRAIAGKCLVDINDLYPEFKESTRDSIDTCNELAEEFHNKTSKIKYGFAPRFVLSCSEELLRESYEMSKNFHGSLYHTHSSENKSEIDAVRKLHGAENIEYFDRIGVLGDTTILAHCIHVNDMERVKLKKSDTRVAHCPSANLKLASGIANIPGYLKEGISVSLGADGPPCNNNLDMFTEMRLASLIQKPIHGPGIMDALTMLRLATIEGAKALHLDSETGSIEIGKKADLVLLDLMKAGNPILMSDAEIYSSIVYSSGIHNVDHVMIEGEWIVRNSESLLFDTKELLATAEGELTKLINRV